MPNASKVEREAADVSDEAAELDYDEQDLQSLFTRGPWRSWNDVARWLEKTGGGEALLSPQQAIAIREDFAQLEKDGVPFVRDPHQVYDLTHNERYRHEA